MINFYELFENLCLAGLCVVGALAVGVLKSIARRVSDVELFQRDRAVDEIFRKAAVLAYLQLKDEDISPGERRGKIIHRAKMIAGDVLLMKGEDLKRWNLDGLVEIALFDMDLMQKKEGGDKIGKTQGSVI